MAAAQLGVDCLYAAKVLRVAPRRQAGQGCVWIVYAAAYIWFSFSSALVAPGAVLHDVGQHGAAAEEDEDDVPPCAVKLGCV